MTDPVDTDALRELRVWLYEESQDDKSELAAAAADEVDQLRAVIENAPHAYECFADFAPGSECICWKADAS